MKTLIIVHIIAALMYIGGVIWAIAEVIFYFGEKDPINFWSVGLLVFGILLAFANIIFAFGNKMN